MKSVESCINMPTRHDSLLTEKGYLSGAILKESEILKAKEAIANREMTQKDSKMELKEFCQKCDHLIKYVMSLLSTCIYLKFISIGLSSFDRTENLMVTCWQGKKSR